MKRKPLVAGGAVALIVGGALLLAQGGGPPPAPASCAARNGLPDARCTPGATSPAVRQDTIATTICVPGYTATVRPPLSYTDPLKRQLMARYGLTDSPQHYELDHLLSLELGGHPTDPANLWPEPYDGPYGARVKDLVENAAHKAVCTGRMTLEEAQRKMVGNWIALGRELRVVGE